MRNFKYSKEINDIKSNIFIKELYKHPIKDPNYIKKKTFSMEGYSKDGGF